jgi:hypothetical protein
MIKTEYEFEQDFYNIVKDCEVAKHVSGKVYKSGLRPPDSDKEDIVVKITTVDSNQLQKGVVTIVIFVPDIDGLGGGRSVPNRNRIGQIQKFCRNFRDEVAQKLKGSYAGLKYETAIKTFSSAELAQSYVSIKLEFNYLS